mmetsp:Transcript_22006/g.51611  ORF Transcript_22006/g.51611 Transcript_22006/m.51611 type:complete len:199 (-) Transcript_22006:223-819(-)|eukprot:CAMPEP_0114558816 /NCGR_PEP_ID=MMETSP0114-20121206/10587_1 /TAXON_ID=31324 /ORGANISM="Goniomonas sp, Strain m" /LENGTH=198 /DNA_ID=CAMNT_0001744239 /DNA_START=159 /DNA_END=755 /DNA_ORIENTATION=+
MEMPIDLKNLYFHSQTEVAQQMGIAVTSLKRKCRAAGVSRYPQQHLQHSMNKHMDSPVPEVICKKRTASDFPKWKSNETEEESTSSSESDAEEVCLQELRASKAARSGRGSYPGPNRFSEQARQRVVNFLRAHRAKQRTQEQKEAKEKMRALLNKTKRCTLELPQPEAVSFPQFVSLPVSTRKDLNLPLWWFSAAEET